MFELLLASTVLAASAHGTNNYCVVDLSHGPQATTYPVTYLSAPPAEGWSDTYRLDKLVLRKIPGRTPYYLGIFEVTQRQYMLVMGKNPSALKGDLRPVECVAWDDLRGKSSVHSWPTVTTVATESFIGRLQSRTGLPFDLPTEKQWSQACSSQSSADLNRLGRYHDNCSDGRGCFSEHTRVGSYEPNSLGLYDLYGNVWEWCLNGKKEQGNSPFRIIRGGCWASSPETCTAYYRSTYLGWNWCRDAFYGFRLALTPSTHADNPQTSTRPTFVSPNPIAPEGKFLADPAGRVGPDGHLYLFCSHDESPKYYCSQQNDVLKTTDLSEWSLTEGIFKTKDIASGIYDKTPLYAPDGIFVNGKWRLFYCTPSAAHAEGVAESPNATGPFQNAHKLPLCRQIDPSVFQDEDGSLYLYWGQFTLKCAKLKNDLSGFEPNSLCESLIDAQHHFFHEGVQVFKRNGLYYLSYTDVSRGGCSCIGYATGPTPTGPFTYRGVIIDNAAGDPCRNNNHGSVLEFRGKWYVFYHRHSNGTSSLRKACVEPIDFDADGLIHEVKMTTHGAGAPLNPFVPTEARLACELSGTLRVTTQPDGQERLSDIRNGDRATWRYFDFKNNATAIEIEYTPSAECQVDVLNEKGQVLGSTTLPASRQESLKKARIPLQKPFAMGLNAITFRFQGESGRALIQLESFTAK